MPRMFVIAAICLASLNSICGAQSHPHKPIDPRVILRISDELLEELIPAQLSRPFEIDTTVESTSFCGSGQAAGSIDVQLESDNAGAAFLVRVDGMAAMRFTGSQDPIRFTSNCRGPFVTTARINFDGHRFLQSETSTWTRQRTSIQSLNSRQKGLIGHVVRRIGMKTVCDARPKMDRYIGERLETGVSQALHAIVQELVSELNDLIAGEITATVARLHPESQGWRWRLTATDSYLEAATGPSTEGEPRTDPVTRVRPQSEIEVWVRIPPHEATILGLSSIWTDSQTLLRSMLDEAEAKLLPPNSSLRAVGNWAVISVGKTLGKHE